MPKEITHWTIANRIREQMENSYIKTSVNNNLELFNIGAVAFDTPYYLIGECRPYFQSLAAYLHGLHGENTFKPLGRVFKQYEKEVPEPDMALATGMLTHIMIDGEFHPLVYYLTGDYNHPDRMARNSAVTRHRKWEAQLDMYYSNNLESLKPDFLSKCLQNKTISDEKLLDLLTLVYSTTKYRKQTQQAVKAQARMLGFLGSRTMYIIYCLGNILSQGRLYPTMALFYPQKAEIKQFQDEFEYVHPADGQKRREKIEDIEKRAISKSLDIIRKWSTTATARELAEINSQMVGPSLETGQ